MEIQDLDVSMYRQHVQHPGSHVKKVFQGGGSDQLWGKLSADQVRQ